MFLLRIAPSSGLADVCLSSRYRQSQGEGDIISIEINPGREVRRGNALTDAVPARFSVGSVAPHASSRSSKRLPFSRAALPAFESRCGIPDGWLMSGALPSIIGRAAEPSPGVPSG